MRNTVPLLVLISGFISGYFIGDYRGEAARLALENATKTGQSLEHELHAANTSLKNDLDALNARYKRDIEKLNGEYYAKSVEWQRIKMGLDDTISRQNSKLAELNSALNELVVRLGGASGVEKVALEQKIALIKKDIDELLREINGNACLEQQVPHSVLDTLSGANQVGSRK